MALITKFVIMDITDNDPKLGWLDFFDNYIAAVERYKELRSFHPMLTYRIGTVSWNEAPNMGNHNATIL